MQWKSAIAGLVFWFAHASSAAELTVADLWQRGDLNASEARMQAALAAVSGDEAMIIRTQLARVHIFRRQFDQARQELEAIEKVLPTAGPEARTYYWLELGRSYASHQHSDGAQTPETRALALEAFRQAMTLAKQAGLDGLAVDALHMMPFAETELEAQIRWNQQAILLATRSTQPAAQRWEPSLRSNLGETLFEAGRYDDALAEFQRALALRILDQAPENQIRDASWHVARTLRVLGQVERALEIQQRLADEALSGNAQRHYIFDELSALYAAQGDTDRAQHFAEHSRQLGQ
ncbi:MAG: tetratricopeptide repeat protein [Pseudomonadota bacterium]